MAFVASTQIAQTLIPEMARDFEEGDLLVDKVGRVGIRTSSHIVRVDPLGHGKSLFVMGLEESTDLFTLAPTGTSFNVSN